MLAAALTAVGETLGSPAYMAPEQALHGTAGPQSDLYSLGCVLHELLAGQQLFTAEVPYALMHKHVEQPPQPLRQLRAEVPAAVERLVLDLLAKEPEQQPAGALAVHQRLLPFLPQPGSGSSPAPAPMDPTRPYRYPLDPRRCVDIRSPAEVTPQVAADVDGARRHAQRLIDEGRFTQAAEILAEAVAAQTRHGDAVQVRELRAATRPRSAPRRSAMSAQRCATSAPCSPTSSGFSGQTTTGCWSCAIRSACWKHRPETCPRLAGRWLRWNETCADSEGRGIPTRWNWPHCLCICGG